MSAIVTNFLLGSVRSTFLLFLTLASLTWTLRVCNWASWLAKSIFLLSIDFPSFWKNSRAVRFFQTFRTSCYNNGPIFVLLFKVIITTFRDCVIDIYIFGWVWLNLIWTWLNCCNSIDYGLTVLRISRFIKGLVRLIGYNPIAFQPASIFFSFKLYCRILK